MSKRTRAWAQQLAEIIVSESLDVAAIADLLEPVCETADAARMLKREIRKAMRRREEIVKQAATAMARKPPPGYVVTNVNGSHKTEAGSYGPPSWHPESGS